LAKQNWIYHRSFVNSLKARVRIKHRLFPDSYDLAQLAEIKSIRDFDERFTSVPNGFANADDYYRRSSAVRVVDKIRIPTLIIHSEDDPFIPCEPLRQQAFSSNPYLLMITTNRGGHVAFIADKQNGDVDRFWAENRVVEFCQLADEEFPRRS
jgi:predicted alpha/beta-fold hydrolase